MFLKLTPSALLYSRYICRLTTTLKQLAASIDGRFVLEHANLADAPCRHSSRQLRRRDVSLAYFDIYRAKEDHMGIGCGRYSIVSKDVLAIDEHRCEKWNQEPDFEK
ncbi:hypothetical protein E4U32_005081 [Claviceps aff. humidiphila group G2b]|nr:hypothetical protein E4U32_005081 [Claviceps aff. humidiphila group G2b]